MNEAGMFAQSVFYSYR